ncbi:MAG: sugar phosphate isomerase/epimerase, partial [Spirochaetaceae bacterium]|nr:sugar phosphate isomerase/epimerase [Spirochaetaceae bacterium]
SCHLKDIRLKEEYTFQLEECACGKGTLDLELFASLATKESPAMPMIIEHLSTDDEYLASINYVQKRLSKERGIL